MTLTRLPPTAHVAHPTPRAPVERRVGGTGPRRDIQGLRALAVTVVILNHLAGKPSGGFVGVDIFFVISGFLITGLLLREHDRTGSISFRGFYRRRIKRILPTALLVLVFAVAGTCALYSAQRSTETAVDAVAAVLSMANWRFSAIGTDYFQAAVPPSPVQHFWSLSVEEQFYFVWPWVMLLVLVLVTRRAKLAPHARAIAGAVLGTVVIVSIGWCAYQTATDPTAAYFSTISRAWELGAGALVAVFAERFSRIPGWLRPVLAWVGLGGIALAILTISSESAFPFPWAVLPVMSTVLVIAAGTGGPARLLWPITNPVACYVGDISYSLYLWHFPLLAFCKSLIPAAGVERAAITLVVVAACSVVSYHLFEDPIRRSGWLEKGGRKRPRRGAGRVGMIAVATAVGMVALVGVGAQAQIANATQPTGPAEPLPSTQRQLSSVIASSLQDKTWPTLTPATNDLQNMYSPALEPDCFNNWDLDDTARCTTDAQTGSKLAVVLGDSIAMSWVPGIDDALVPAGYDVHAVGFSNCPVVLGTIVWDEYTARCSAEHDAILRAVVRMKPSLIIVSDSIYGISRLTGGDPSLDSSQQWTKARAAALRVLMRSGAQVVLLETNPDGAPISDCRTNITGPSACARTLSDAWLQMDAADRAAARITGARFIDSRQWFCVAGSCPAVIGTTPVRWDAIHLTRQYSAALAPFLRRALLAPARAG